MITAQMFAFWNCAMRLSSVNVLTVGRDIATMFRVIHEEYNPRIACSFSDHDFHEQYLQFAPLQYNLQRHDQGVTYSIP
ncbi:unnamed protein product [Brugia timori]|uniref:Uncharacterized protein n=1 Tax=Brugia timori TaxID=42155 RepID=A0A3P7VTZ4_9BILA|nr:unnamed protein product [Brugia timori]